MRLRSCRLRPGPAADHCGYQTVALREVLAASRPKYFQLLGAATAAAVQAAVAADGLAPVEVATAGRAEELFRQLALPLTFHAEARAPPAAGAWGAARALHLAAPLLLAPISARRSLPLLPPTRPPPPPAAAGRRQQAAALQGAVLCHGA